MKKLRLKKEVKDFLISVAMVSVLAIVSVLVLNARFSYLNQKNSAGSNITKISQHN